MNRTLANTLAVLIVTLFTAIAIFATVELSGLVSGTAAPTAVTASAAGAGGQLGLASSASAGTVMTCPATGCAATSCHAAR